MSVMVPLAFHISERATSAAAATAASHPCPGLLTRAINPSPPAHTGTACTGRRVSCSSCGPGTGATAARTTTTTGGWGCVKKKRKDCASSDRYRV